MLGGVWLASRAKHCLVIVLTQASRLTSSPRWALPAQEDRSGGPAELVETKGFGAAFRDKATVYDPNEWSLCKVNTGFVEGEPVEAGGEMSAKRQFSKAAVSGQIFKCSASLSAQQDGKEFG